MSLRCGIIGLPNVGKSTIFNALTSSNAQASNYPFCTIKPNVGQVRIPDERLEQISKYSNSKKIVPAMMEFVDIAGLVKGASKGEGLGNQFLANISEMDTLAHVVRCFDDGDVVHVEGQTDPIRDIGIVETEIVLKDIEIIDRFIQREKKVAKSGDNVAKKRVEAAQTLSERLNDGTQLRCISLKDDQKQIVDELKLLSAKKVLYVINIGEDLIGVESDAIKSVKEYAEKVGSLTVCMSGKIEQELLGLDENDRTEFLSDLGIDRLGLYSLIAEAYRLLEIVTFFTANENELHAWTVQIGTKLPQAAGKIHTDFEKGFIRAEVISYDDYIVYQGEAGAKEKGVMRVEGKESCVNEGDIIFFRFNT